jgi:hypothetical protein
MPTMIRRYQCGECNEQHEHRSEAEQCAQAHYYLQAAGSSVDDIPILELNLWECDGNGCQRQHEDQFRAQECEASHEIGAEDGRQDTNSMIAEMGDHLCEVGLTQAGHIFKRAGRHG